VRQIERFALAWPLLLAALLPTAGSPAATAAPAAEAGRGGWNGTPPIPLRGLPQPASITATPRLRLPTGTPLSGLTPAATGTLTRVIGTPGPGERTPGPAPDEARTPAPGTAGGPAAGGSAAGTAPADPATTPGGAGSTDPAPPAGSAAAGAPVRGGDSRAVTDRAKAPSGLLSAPAEDPGIRRLWEATGSPRAGQSWLARLTADRPGPWGWGLSYPLLGLAFLWTFRRVWQRIGDLRAGAQGQGGEGRT
jgi:hypothetical protein